MRSADVGWLRRAMSDGGLEPLRTRPAQLTESFVDLREGSLRARAVHALNRAWFRVGRGTRRSLGVFVIARRPPETGS